jgi:hypothetical protein
VPDELESDDIRAIDAIVARQFGSLAWAAGGEGDWDAFARDFLVDAPLYPSARPARQQSVKGFVERMKGLSQASLHTFTERVLGSHIRVFGNVAVALAACEIVENNEKVSRGVEAMLLIKENGAWKIAAQAWDMEGEGKRIPGYLLAAG